MLSYHLRAGITSGLNGQFPVQLARRLFYSFAKPGVDYLLLEDIAKYFPTPEDAEAAWNLFDKDGNGDATRDEVEMTCM